MENRTTEWILHIDGDAFFASCEVSRRPDLFDKPVVVGEERGIATALTYSAKALGIKRGDPIFKIKKEYPNVVILSSHFELYNKFAGNLAKILIPEVYDFEAYSIDECFASLKGTKEEVQLKVIKLKKLIQDKIGITYSFGVSITKTLAKVASKRNKPNGLCFLMDDQKIKEALQTTKVENIWGIGYATNKKLVRNNILTAFDFIHSDLKFALKDSYTKPIFQTKDELSGNTHFKVGILNPYQKSLQSTRSLINRTTDINILKGELSRNIEVACSEMRKKGLVTNKVHMFVSPKNPSDIFLEKCFDLVNFTNAEMHILKQIEHLFDKSVLTGKVVYKKTGVTMLNLLPIEEIPDDLFGCQIETSFQESKITNVIDGLRKRFGYNSISLASSLTARNKRVLDYEKRHLGDYYESGLPFPFLGVIS